METWTTLVNLNHQLRPNLKKHRRPSPFITQATGTVNWPRSNTTVLIAVSAFFLSMVGDGEPNYDVMQIGAYGCCSLLNVAFISQAIYQRNLMQHHAMYGGEKTGSKPGYIAAVLLAFFSTAILLGNLFSNY